MSAQLHRPSFEGAADDTFRGYLRDIGRIDRIDYHEELELGRAIQAGLRAEEALAAWSALDPPPDCGEEERARLLEMVDAGHSARRRLADANLRLVIYIARSYPQMNLSLADLVQEGNMGLLKAVERFDPERGTRFSTFAVFWIRQRIRVALARQGSGFGVPAKVRRETAMLREARSRLEGQLGRKPRVEDLARETGLDLRRIEQLERWDQRALELDREVGDAGGISFGDLVPDPDSDEPQRRTRRHELEARVAEAMATLGEQEAKVLELWFGLGGAQPMRCNEIAEQLGLSEARIRQIKKRAIRMLRHPRRSTGLRGLDE